MNLNNSFDTVKIVVGLVPTLLLLLEVDFIDSHYNYDSDRSYRCKYDKFLCCQINITHLISETWIPDWFWRKVVCHRGPVQSVRFLFLEEETFIAYCFIGTIG